MLSLPNRDWFAAGRGGWSERGGWPAGAQLDHPRRLESRHSAD